MATVYSLVCWGGRTGKTVTMTIASPCVVSLTNHGLRDGTGIVFSTTGALPTGITAGTTYYIRSTATGTFDLYDTEAHAKDTGSTTGRINTSGSQSGTHTAKSKKMIDYLASPPTTERWGASGSERCYDGLVNWASGRSGALAVDEEVCEIGQAFTEIVSSGLQITIPCAVYTITTTINGQRTEAFHSGAKTTGYLFANSTTGIKLRLTRPQGTVEGFVIEDTSANYRYQSTIQLEGFLTKAKNMIVAGNVGYVSTSIGVELYGQITSVENTLVYGFYEGIRLYQYVGSPSILNCIATKNTYGINAANTGGANGNGATVINTISIGNTTLNWFNTDVTNLRAATNNLGGTSEAWIYGSGTRITVTESSPFSSLFSDWTNLVFTPASVSSASVDTGAEYYGIADLDIADNTRPSYTGSNYGESVAAGSFVTGLVYVIEAVGTTDFTAIGASANTVGVTFKATVAGSGTGAAILQAVVDVGCFEYDHGYGDWPASTTVTFSGVNAGSEIRVYDASANELAGVESCSANPALTWTLVSGDARIVIVHPDYKIKEFTYTPVSGAVSLPVQQEPDKWYSNP